MKTLTPIIVVFGFICLIFLAVRPIVVALHASAHITDEPNLTVAAKALENLTHSSEPTADKIITVPDKTGTMIMTPDDLSGSFLFFGTTYGKHNATPEHVEDMDLEFHDADGKTWVAKWEEKK